MRSLLLTIIVATASAVTVAQNQAFLLSSRDRAQSLAVDFVATGTDGHPLTTLNAGEVSVRIGGRARRVLALEYVRASRPDSANVAPPFGDNAEPPVPRSVVLMVDEDTIRPGRTGTVRDAARRLLAGLAPDDRVALVTVPFGGLAVDLTTDHTRIVQALANLAAMSLRNESPAEAQCRTVSTLGAMTDTLRRLSVVEDPVTVVLFSSNQTGPQNMIRMTGDPSSASACELRASTFQELGAAAAGARARFFVVHADLDQRGRGLDGLEHITGVTGAPLLHLSTADGRAAVDRILRDTSGHFVARVAREPADRPGEALGVSIHVSKPGVTVWRVPTLVVPRLPPAPTPASPASPATTLDLMRRPQVTRDLPLRLSAHSFRGGAAGETTLAVSFDAADSGASLSSAMIGAFDAGGQLVAGLEISAEALTQRPVVAALAVPTGAYRLRVAAVESTGRAGSVEIDVETSLTPMGPLTMSSLLVGLSRGGGFVPAMTFRDEPTAFAMLELYGEGAAVGAVFEVAASSNGPALVTMPGLVEPSDDPSRRIVTAVLPIRDLAPGDYVVRATLTPAGQPSGRVVRTLRKIGS